MSGVATRVLLRLASEADNSFACRPADQSATQSKDPPTARPMSREVPRAMKLTAQQRVLRARYAATRRHHPKDTATAHRLLRELRESQAADYIREVVDAAPPLTDDQRHRLALLLRRQVQGGDPG